MELYYRENVLYEFYCTAEDIMGNKIYLLTSRRTITIYLSFLCISFFRNSNNLSHPANVNIALMFNVYWT